FWKIAQEQMGSGTKYAELAAYNGLDPSATIYAGQVLKIPGGSAPAPAPAPTMRVGAQVQYSGPLYTDSYGGGKGKTVSGTYTVSRVIEGRKCGVLLNGGLGWVSAGSCTVVG
ncbi:LysM peptidoglycan-binding domain-containing protein, partial [Akkermansia muciniphila]|uniref:LysM peptidoglycan-binding domain-containing protein n=1 Tax=Akkermansia muciniphila TaxID=239935 RepID=UPI00122EFFF7